MWFGTQHGLNRYDGYEFCLLGIAEAKYYLTDIIIFSFKVGMKK